MIVRKTAGFFKDFYDKSVNERYDVTMGIVSSSVIALFEFVSFLAVDPSMLRSINYFLLTTGLMLMQLVFFVLIYLGVIPIDSLLEKIIVFIHPYLIISIGVIISFAYQGHTNQIYSFIIAVFATALVQLYPLWRRVSVFLFALVSFNLMIALTEGFQNFFSDKLRISIMAVVLAYVFTLVQYRSDLSQRRMTNVLKKQNENKEEAFERLKKAYDDIEQNYRITEMMLTITSQMLNTDFFDDVLQTILEDAIKAVPKVSAGSILISNGKVMEYRAAVGYDLKRLKEISLLYEDIFQSDLEDPFEPAIIPNLKQYDEMKLKSGMVDHLKDSNALIDKSVLTCAIKKDDEFFGSINLDISSPEFMFDESDKRMIKQLAKQIEIIITIHSLYGNALRGVRYDYLTNACTRSYHHELLQLAYKEALENNTPLTICSIDINNLKEINDSFGHEAGDDYLIYFVEGIRKLAGNNYFLSRVGGDEFFLVFPNTTEAEAKEKVETIREYFAMNPFIVQGIERNVTFGCGIVCCAENKCDLEKLVKLSDTKMYQNKAEMKKLNESKK